MTAPALTILASLDPAAVSDLEALVHHFAPDVPADYLRLIASGTEIEYRVGSSGYLRVWSPLGCIEMDQGYDIRSRIPGSFPFGDDGGGRFLCYAEGSNGRGVYLCGYGAISREDLTWVTTSIESLVEDGIGLNNLE
jgi:hypothetical protein